MKSKGTSFIRSSIQDLEDFTGFSITNNHFLDKAIKVLDNFIESPDNIFSVNKSSFESELVFKNFCRLFKYFGNGFAGTGVYQYNNTYFEVNPFSENGPVLIKKTWDELKEEYNNTLANYTQDKEWLSKPENIEWLKSTRDIYNLNILFDTCSMLFYQEAIKSALNSIKDISTYQLATATTKAKDIF